MKQPTFHNALDSCSHTSRGAQLQRRRPLSAKPRTVIDELYRMAPMGWTFEVSYAPSHSANATVWTGHMAEDRMGWSFGLHADSPGELIPMAQATIDKCMATCLPDQGNGVGMRLKCPSTQGGDSTPCTPDE